MKCYLYYFVVFIMIIMRCSYTHHRWCYLELIAHNITPSEMFNGLSIIAVWS
jgi:hypothetical protein